MHLPKKLKSYKLQATRGAVALVSTLLISAIIMEIAIAVVIISSTLLNTGNNEKLSSEALKAAYSGIQDALIRVVRYCPIVLSFSCPSSYTIVVGSRSVEITIDAPIENPRKITATSAAGLVRKKIEAVLDINASTGEVETRSIKEVSL